MVKIVIIAAGLNNGVIDAGVSSVDITHHIGILGSETGKVDIDGLGLGLLRLGLLLGLLILITLTVIGSIRRGSVLVAGSDVIGDDLILNVLGICLLLKVADDLGNREHQNTQQDHQNNIIQNFILLFLAAGFRCGFSSRFFHLTSLLAIQVILTDYI